jgi:hypothetical protein
VLVPYTANTCCGRTAPAAAKKKDKDEKAAPVPVDAASPSGATAVLPAVAEVKAAPIVAEATAVLTTAPEALPVAEASAVLIVAEATAGPTAATAAVPTATALGDSADSSDGSDAEPLARRKPDHEEATACPTATALGDSCDSSDGNVGEALPRRSSSPQNTRQHRKPRQNQNFVPKNLWFCKGENDKLIAGIYFGPKKGKSRSDKNTIRLQLLDGDNKDTWKVTARNGKLTEVCKSSMLHIQKDCVAHWEDSHCSWAYPVLPTENWTNIQTQLSSQEVTPSESHAIGQS